MAGNNAYLTVNFGSISSGSTSLELNEYKNLGKTDFSSSDSDEKCYLMLFPANTNATIFNNIGTVSLLQKNVTYIDENGNDYIEEDVVFSFQDSNSLRYIPSGSVEYSWLGKKTPNDVIVEFDGSSVNLSKKTAGVLRVKYSTKYDSYVAKSSESGSQLIVAQSDYGVASTTVNWDSIKVDVYITVKDACNKFPVEGAEVFIDDIKLDDLTDENGRVYAGELSPGRHHINVQKTGYVSSGLDVIKNDYFEVPSEW